MFGSTYIDLISLKIFVCYRYPEVMIAEISSQWSPPDTSLVNFHMLFCLSFPNSYYFTLEIKYNVTPTWKLVYNKNR